MADYPANGSGCNREPAGFFKPGLCLYTAAMRTLRIPARFNTLPAALTLLLAVSLPLAAQPPATGPVAELAGTWLFNKELSDDTDDKVEAALREAGEKVRRRLFERRDDVYRGGPPEQELYDRISYDKLLEIDLSGEIYHFTYAGEFERPVYTDNRSRSVSLTELDRVEDFSLGHWENGKLLVEARPRDGGVAEETYTLLNDGTQLQVDLYIKPRTFEVPIELTRVFDRQPAATPAP